ncbi:MAG: ribose ABC transporter permease [Ignavibacteriales bacterium]|nr:MAG: ribose ABC transporter permease [Ignavibacteriales bacterium]
MKKYLSKALSEYGVGVALILEIILFSQLSQYFFTADNLLNVTLQVSITAIIAVGMTFVILTGGIDLSVGSVVAVTGIIATSLIKFDFSASPFLLITVSVIVALVFGFLSGSAAGFFITKFKVTPFIITLALMTVWRGAAFVYTDGRPVWGLPEMFSVLGGGRFIGIPIPTIIMIIIFITAHIVLTKTRFGRYVYAVGGNEEAARLVGIKTNKILITVYSICGLLSALSGILLASRMNSGQPNAGQMYELDVIAAVVVGGTSLNGGRGTILGTFFGAMLIAILRNGLNLLNVNSYVQQVIVGVVILLAVLMDRKRGK